MADPSVSVEFNADAAVKAMQSAPQRVERAVRRSLNRTGTTGRAEMARLIAKDMGLKVSDAKAAVLLQQATGTQLAIRLSASLKRLPLLAFDARQTRTGVSYRGQGGARKTLAHAFIATMPTGHTGVFLRTGAQRERPRPGRKTDEKIAERRGASVGHVFDRYRNQVLEVMRAAFDKTLGNELKFASTENG